MSEGYNRRGGGGASSPGTAGLTPTATKTAAYAAAVGDLVRANASGTTRTVYDAATTNANATLTSATAAFVNATYPAGDVGAPISGLGLNPGTTILSVTNATTVVLSANATQTATGMVMTIGNPGITITLPAGAAQGQAVAVKRFDASGKPVTVIPSGSDTIDGFSSIAVTRQYTARTFVKDSAATWVAREGLTVDRPLPGNIVNWIGDSIAPQGSNTTHSMNGSGSATDYLWWAHLLSNARILWGKVAGIGSTRADHMAARIYDMALAEGGHFCGIQTGTNDSIFGFTGAQYAAYIKTMTAATVAAGQTPILCTPPPIPSNVTQRPLDDQYRRFLTAYARDNNWPLIDFYSLLVDPATGGYLSAYDSGDNTHPNVAGKQAMGQLISDQLAAWLPPHQPPVAMTNVTTDASSLLPNGLFLTDTNADGVPDQWTKAGGTATASVVVAPAGVKGNAMRLSDAASGGFTQLTTANLGSTGRGSHRIAFCGYIKSAGITGHSLVCNLKSPTAGAQITLKSGCTTSTTPAGSTSGWWKFYCEGTAPSDVNSIDLSLNSNGGTALDVQVAQLGVYDLTASGY